MICRRLNAITFKGNLIVAVIMDDSDGEVWESEGDADQDMSPASPLPLHAGKEAGPDEHTLEMLIPEELNQPSVKVPELEVPEEFSKSDEKKKGCRSISTGLSLTCCNC